MLNAAVWLGAMVFFSFIVGPAIFSPEMKAIMQLDWIPGAVAQGLIDRYLVLQQWCAGIALLHLIVEWLYNGRPFPKALLVILVFCLGISLAGSRVLTPRMKQLHLVKYAKQTSQTEKDTAKSSFGILHATSQATNLLALGGVLFYYWRLSVGTQGARPGAGARFRS
jgi:hypothetical protein